MKDLQEYFNKLMSSITNYSEDTKVRISCIALITIIMTFNLVGLLPQSAVFIILGFLLVLLLMKKINDVDLIIYSLILPSETYIFIGIGIGLISILVRIIKKEINFKNLINDIVKDKFLILLLSLIGISSIVSIISTGIIFNAVASVGYLLVMLFIFKVVKIDKYNFDNLYLIMDNIFIIQVIVFIPLMIMDIIRFGGITSGDMYRGTFGNAHMLCLWLILYGTIMFIKYKDSIHKQNKIFAISKLITFLLMVYLSDGKHLWIATILALITYYIICRFKNLSKIATVITGIIIILGLFIVTNITKIEGFKENISSKSEYVSMYIYKEPFNTKFEYFDSTLNEKLKGYNFLIGYGPGQYGSRVANLRAYEHMAKSEGIAVQLSKILSPYVLEEYKDQASKYDEEFVEFIPNMSAVLGYPFSSIIAIIAEVGILGVIAYLLFLNCIANKTKIKEGHFLLILLLFLMIFDSYFEMTSGITMIWIIMGVLQKTVEFNEETSNKKKKILIAQYSLGGGGAEKVLLDILNNVDSAKYEVDVFLLRKEGVYLNKLNKNVRILAPLNNIKFKNDKMNEKLNDIRFLLIKFLPKVVHKLVVGNEYDVEIAFVEGLTSKFVIDSCNKKSKKIAWVHIDLEKYKPIKEFFQKRFYPKFDLVACVSEDSKRVFEKLYPNLSAKTRVVYNLIDSKQIIELANEDVEFNEGVPTIIGVGRLSIQKRFDVLIKAHKLLIDDGINHKLLILGEGDKKSELETLINELGVGETVDLHGFVNNPYKYIKKSKVFAMSSDFEGLPLVVCESLVLGKPIVATRCTGPTELLADGEYGLLVDCDNEKQLKEALKLILTDEKLSDYYSNKSLERSMIFDTKEAINNIYDIFELEV